MMAGGLPGDVGSLRPLTVGGFLQLTSVRAAAPEVIAAARGLERTIRWVHECETWSEALDADAGSLVLFGDQPGPVPPIALLAERGLAALCLPQHDHAPALDGKSIAAAEAAGLPVVALHEIPRSDWIVREAVTRILRRTAVVQQSVLSADARLLATVSSGGSVDELLSVLAELLDNPVAMVAANGQLIAAANPARLPRDPFDSWPAPADGGPPVIAALPATDNEPARSLRAYSRGARLPEHTAAVLEHAAGLASIVSPAAPARAKDARMRFDAMQSLRGDDTVSGVAARLRRAGFRADRSLLVAFVIRNDRDSFLEIDEWSDVAVSIQEQWPGGQDSLIISRSDDSSAHGLLAVRSSGEQHRAIDTLAGIVATVFDSIELLPPHLVVGEPTNLPEVRDELVATTQAAYVLSARGEHADQGSWTPARRVELARYLWNLQGSAEAPLFVRRALGELSAMPAGQDHLLSTLKIYCETLGQKAEAARRLHLNRQTLYARLQRIEEIARVDLDDPETIVMLYLAMRLRDG